MSKWVRNAKTFQRSSFRHNGIAGSGVAYDDYSEASGNPKRYQDKVIVKMPPRDVIKAIGADPLYGNRSGKQGKTHWMAFIKEGE